MPLYEYACRSCGSSFERMRRMDERLAAPECPSCTSDQTVLRLSAPGMVGARTGVARTNADSMPSCGSADPGSCCGGACMAPNLN
jgi:putative FmdB family regulatory protein